MSSVPTVATFLYGINNCDTVKKARKWLKMQRIDIPFQDYREQPLTSLELSALVKMAGWEAILNKRSTSYRNLSDDDKSDINEDKAITLMQAHPTLIKRPVLFDGDKVLLGFKEADYKKWFNL